MFWLTEGLLQEHVCADKAVRSSLNKFRTKTNSCSKCWEALAIQCDSSIIPGVSGSCNIPYVACCTGFYDERSNWWKGFIYTGSWLNIHLAKRFEALSKRMLEHITNTTTGLKNWQMNAWVLHQSKATLVVVRSAPSTDIQTLSWMTTSLAGAVFPYTHSLTLTIHQSILTFWNNCLVC